MCLQREYAAKRITTGIVNVVERRCQAGAKHTGGDFPAAAVEIDQRCPVDPRLELVVETHLDNLGLDNDLPVDRSLQAVQVFLNVDQFAWHGTHQYCSR